MLLSRIYLNMERHELQIWRMLHGQTLDAQLMSLSEIATDGFNDINNKEWMWGADITGETTGYCCFVIFISLFL